MKYTKYYGVFSQVNLPQICASSDEFGVFRDAHNINMENYIKIREYFEELETEKEMENEKIKTAEIKKDNSTSELQNIQKLKSYKELLDIGAISQEEFDAKKKELL